jgi:putative ABC transport system substrate-binding protein
LGLHGAKFRPYIRRRFGYDADVNRRNVISFLIGGAALAPLAAHAQQSMPVIGLLGGSTAKGGVPFVTAFRRGLSEAGFVEGRNVTIEDRWAEGRYDRLPALAAELIQSQVAVLVAFTTPAALAAKAATATIPVVFSTIADPVQLGLVASLSRPGGNVTGLTSLIVEVGPKLLELLHELVPTATDMALLVNPNSPNIEILSRDVQAAARALGLKLHVLRASDERGIDAAFASLVQLRAGGLVIGADTVFSSRSGQIAALALRHAVPSIVGSTLGFAAAGLLMSYGGSQTDQYRQVGVYAGRVLKGEKPADLPVLQSAKFEMIINLTTAKALGITVPPKLMFTADEVIE